MNQILEHDEVGAAKARQYAALINKGLSYTEIAEVFGVSKQAVWEVCRRHGLRPDPITIVKDRDEQYNKAKIGGKLVSPIEFVGIPMTRAEADVLLRMKENSTRKDPARNGAIAAIAERISQRYWRFQRTAEEAGDAAT